MQRVAHLMRADEAGAAEDEDALGRRSGGSEQRSRIECGGSAKCGDAPADEFAPALHGMDSENVG